MLVLYSLSLSLSLSVSPTRIPCKPKLSIKLAFLFLLFGLHTYFRTLFFTWYQSARVENLCSRLSLKGKPNEKNKKNRMDRGMASSLPTEKLDRNNYASWFYKMHQYLLGHGYWSYVDGANDTAPDSTHRDFLTWEQSVSRVLYFFASCVDGQLLSYIRDAKTLKDAWGNLKKIFSASTTAKKFQL